MKIGLISDIHATSNPLREALEIFSREGVDKILCAGDIAGYGHELDQTVALLKENDCQVIIGNHDFWWLESEEGKAGGLSASYLQTLPTVVDLSAAGKTIHMVHASPPGSLMEGLKLLDEKAEMMPDQKSFWADYLRPFPFDVLVVGHTHQVLNEKLGDVLVVNPGSTLFNHTCAILTLPEMTVQLFPLSGKKPVMSWNWGLFYSEDQQQDL